VAVDDPEPNSDRRSVWERLGDPDWWPEPPSETDREEALQLLRRLSWWQRTRLLALAAAARWLHVALVWAEVRETRRPLRAARRGRAHVKK